MKNNKFGNYEIKIDIEKTKGLYQNLESHECDGCLLYSKLALESPKEVKNFFESCGLDISKPIETWNYKKGKMIYNAVYHVVGNILSFDKKNDWYEIFENYSIKLTKNLDFTNEDYPENVFQINASFNFCEDEINKVILTSIKDVLKNKNVTKSKDAYTVILDEKVNYIVKANEVIINFFGGQVCYSAKRYDLYFLEYAITFITMLLTYKMEIVKTYKGKKLHSEKYYVLIENEKARVDNIFYGFINFSNPFAKKKVVIEEWQYLPVSKEKKKVSKK